MYTFACNLVISYLLPPRLLLVPCLIKFLFVIVFHGAWFTKAVGFFRQSQARCPICSQLKQALFPRPQRAQCHVLHWLQKGIEYHGGQLDAPIEMFSLLLAPLIEEFLCPWNLLIDLLGGAFWEVGVLVRFLLFSLLTFCFSLLRVPSLSFLTFSQILDQMA